MQLLQLQYAFKINKRKIILHSNTHNYKNNIITHTQKKIVVVVSSKQ